MRMFSIRSGLAAAFVLTAVGGGLASAHDQIDSLGGTASATDLWNVNCSGGSAYLAIRVQDGPPNASPKVSLQVIKDNQALSTTDNKDGDRRASPEVKLFGGDGDYLVIVDKTGAPTETYAIAYHCESASGGHTPTTIAPVQVQ